jgi:hypothetical protein
VNKQNDLSAWFPASQLAEPSNPPFRRTMYNRLCYRSEFKADIPTATIDPHQRAQWRSKLPSAATSEAAPRGGLSFTFKHQEMKLG